ncbi:MAG TPA: hypothetical protein VK929_09020 [Longimicrobiales bacterium]|nr:hypothetical protein [Longimicrobiales bacterium]
MTTTAALPFTLRRSSDVVRSLEVTSTAETIDGLLRLEEDRLVVQWRVRREISHVGLEIRTDEELEPVREAVLPLDALAGAAVRQQGWGWFRRTQLTLTAADLRAFEDVAGAAGLRLAHPATLELAIPRAEQLTAREFAAELNVRLAEHALPEAARDRQRLSPSSHAQSQHHEG